jgi:hypothetical protein
VATNPPYLNKYDDRLRKYISDNYKAYKGDLFSVFMYHNFDFCINGGYSAFMTPMVWMFIKTYEELRQLIISQKSITTLIQFEYSAFEEATVPISSFVFKNKNEDMDGGYFKLSDFRGGMEVQKEKVLNAIKDSGCGYYYEINSSNFLKIPGSPIAFWAGINTFSAYDGKKIVDYYTVRNGISTGDNNRYLRLWHEIDYSRDYWKPCNKGGAFRKWYGNNEYFVFWENDGHSIRTSLDEKGRIKARLGGIEYSFQEGIEMSRITSGSLGFRFSFPGFVYESSTNDIYQISQSKDLYTALGYFNSVVVSHFLSLMNPTINIMPEDLRGLPCFEVTNDVVTNLVQDNIEYSKQDWNSFETSWDFKTHPLVELSKGLWDATATAASMDFYYGKLPKTSCPIETCYLLWQGMCNERFEKLKKNEEELNRIFIDIYGLQDELTAEVEDKDITVRKADLQRDIRSLISYAVGCMFGRYSVDFPGLIYAGGEWDETKYHSFKPDADAIVPICDDEYFEDDIVGRFITFLEVVFGKESLEDNLKYIAEVLGGKGSAREVIRNYFLNDFYADHVKTYQKRPVYWLFDSGKKNGFKCLVYMHRYKPDTIARIRTDYVHEQQARYRTAIEEIEKKIESAAASEKIKLDKKLSTLKSQDEELHSYEEKIHHFADQMINIDLDEGVKVNYAKFQGVLTRIC